MNETVYFFDSYAIIEIFKGNPNYKKYSENTVLITKLNLFEVYYAFLRESKVKEANWLIDKYFESVIDFNQDIIKKAAELKLKHKKRKLSMVDCIGYVLAYMHDIKFLTGDKEFKDFQNVEYVK